MTFELFIKQFGRTNNEKNRPQIKGKAEDHGEQNKWFPKMVFYLRVEM